MRRPVFIIVLTLLVAAALAACGGGDSGGGGEATAAETTAESVLASAVSNAEGAGSSKVSFSITTQVPGQEGPVAITGEGAFDYAGQKGELTYDLGGLLESVGAPAGDDTMEMIFEGDVFYMKFSLLSSLIPGGKPWIKFDLASLGSEQGLDLSQLGPVNQGDPSQTLEYLRAAGSVEEVGQEQVRGVEATHYRAVIDLDQVVESAPAEAQEQLRESIDQLKEQAGVTELPMDVWLDGEGRPVKIEYSISGAITGTDTGGEEVSTIFSMELYDWGTEVSIELPPPDQVTDVSELASLGGATTG